MKDIKMKEWFYDKMMSEVCKYGDIWQYIEEIRDENDLVATDVDGYVTITSPFEILKETEKAMYINFSNTWKAWCPKSVIKFVNRKVA